jgi:signal peptidase II
MSEMPAARQSGLMWWPAGVLAILADQLSKAWITRHFALQESVSVLPVLDIIHTRNTGAAFSFLAGAGGWQRWFFITLGIAVSAFILFYLRKLDARGQKLQSAGLMLIAGGALGNVIDRIHHGFVVDFVAAHWDTAYFPAFNVADSCITVGAGLLLLDALLEWRREHRAVS